MRPEGSALRPEVTVTETERAAVAVSVYMEGIGSWDDCDMQKYFLEACR